MKRKILSLLLAVFLLYLLLAMALPQIYLSIVGLVNAFPEYINSVQEWLQKFLADNPDIQNTVMSVYVSAADSLEEWLNADILPNLESVTTTVQWLRQSVLPNLTGVMSSVSALVVSLALLVKDLLIALIVTFYLLIRKDVFAAQSKKIIYSALPTHVGDLVVEETRSAYRIMSGFINGKLLDSLVIGIIALVCCNMLSFPYPALLATIIGVTNVIPFFGPFIGAAVAQSGETLHEFGKLHLRPLEHNHAILADVDDLGIVVRLDVRRLVARRRDVHAVFKQGRGDHEDDQQEEQRVNQRGDVDLIERRIAETMACHAQSSSSPYPGIGGR